MTEEIIPTQFKKQNYKIYAKYYKQKIVKEDLKRFFFNQKKFMLKNNVYLDGFLITHSSYIKYKKAYRLNNKLYLFNTEGNINHQDFKAKELVYDGSGTYILRHCTIITSSRILRRKEFLLKENYKFSSK